VNRSRLFILLCVAATPLLMGQFCGAPAPVVPKSLTGIAEGTYSGVLSCTAQVYVNNELVETRTYDGPEMVSFDAEGRPLSSSGIPLVRGHQEYMNLGEWTLSGEVQQVDLGGGQATIWSTFETSFSSPAGSLKVGGVLHVVYAPAGSGVRAEMRMDSLPFSLETDVGTLVSRCSGTLY